MIAVELAWAIIVAVAAVFFIVGFVTAAYVIESNREDGE